MTRVFVMRRHLRRWEVIRSAFEVTASIIILASVLFMGLFGQILF